MTSTWKIADTGKGVVFPPLCSHQSLIAFGWLPNRVTQLKVIQVTKSQHTHVASGCCLKIVNIKRRDGETGRTNLLTDNQKLLLTQALSKKQTTPVFCQERNLLCFNREAEQNQLCFVQQRWMTCKASKSVAAFPLNTRTQFTKHTRLQKSHQFFFALPQLLPSFILRQSFSEVPRNSRI